MRSLIKEKKFIVQYFSSKLILYNLETGLICGWFCGRTLFNTLRSIEKFKNWAELPPGKEPQFSSLHVLKWGSAGYAAETHVLIHQIFLDKVAG